MADIASGILAEKTWHRGTGMKISVSNIAWENKELEKHLALLKELRCDGVEIAPSCIWKEPISATREEIKSFKEIIDKYELEIPALHALLFTRPDLYLFGDKATRDETILYLKALIRLAGELSVKVLVYGSPKSRRVGDKSYDKCYTIAINVFSELAKEASLYNTCFCIEPLDQKESDFINTASEGYRLVQDIDSLHFGLHLDARAMFDSQENFEAVFGQYGKVIKHFHVGDPGLAPPGYTGLDHSVIGGALYKSPYKGFVSIEMRRGFGDSIEVVKNAVLYVREKYRIS